ncbi:MAG: YqgE/AlgH family protein [Pseudomonadota bacterium]|nr:YqgE/AlgH family protein [Pseudomonadota bacterium]MEC8467410.1 YqgE/AlgH family protein [Pseudomonadota bacterium]
MTTPQNKMIDNLTGYFLMATENLADTYFEGALVFVCSHEAEMTLGLVVNQEMIEMSFEDILESLYNQIEVQAKDVQDWPTLMAGGPVEIEKGLVLHSNDYKCHGTIELTPEISLSSSAQIIQDICKGKGPKKYNLCMGYSGWSPLQLEEEIAEHDWMVVPATADVLFHDEVDERFQAAAEKMGFNFNNYAGFVGEA